MNRSLAHVISQAPSSARLLHHQPHQASGQRLLKRKRRESTRRWFQLLQPVAGEGVLPHSGRTWHPSHTGRCSPSSPSSPSSSSPHSITRHLQTADSPSSPSHAPAPSRSPARRERAVVRVLGEGWGAVQSVPPLLSPTGEGGRGVRASQGQGLRASIDAILSQHPHEPALAHKLALEEPLAWRTR